MLQYITLCCTSLCTNTIKILQEIIRKEMLERLSL